MRRLLLVAALGLLVAPVAACTSGDPATQPTPEVPTTTTTVAANDEEICTEFEALFDGANFETIGASIGEYLVYREAGMTDEATEAETKIKDHITTIADQVSDLSGRATNEELKANLGDVETEVRSATDLAFLEGVESPEDLQGPMTTMLMGWITPVALSCEIS